MPAEPRFMIGDDDFLLDGRPLQILAGSLHYFRVHPDQWADRIEKARLMGLNTIETYVAWNFHSPVRGEFATDGPRDLQRFLSLVHAAGLHAIVRPGPYICAEWDNGGLPGWLFADPDLRLRRHEPRYLAAVTEYFDALLPLLAPLQIDRGGPIITVQIENEYGAYGSDQAYLRALVELTRAGGITVPLTTVDQPTDAMLSAGSLPELHKTASFGSRPLERLAVLRRHQPTGPLMCAEFWDGWFDHWGEHHHTTPSDTAADDLDALLQTGASVTIYMFSGGTNFGFTNGANHKGIYRSHVTSYDYDAPLDEAGNPTEKYHAFKQVLSRCTGAVLPDPASARPAPEFEVRLDRWVSVREVADVLGDPHRSDGDPPTMDALGHHAGFCLYRTTLGGRGGLLTFGTIRDRAVASVDGVVVGTVERDHHDRVLPLPAGEELELLVEDRGRVNYGPRLGEPKGIIGPVTLDGCRLTGWTSVPLRLDHLDAGSLATAALAAGPVSGPAFLDGSFALDHPEDLFLDTLGWSKGVVWVNGTNLGRYWSRGPQRTLFVPAGVLRAGHNQIVVLELRGVADPRLRFVAEPSLGHLED